MITGERLNPFDALRREVIECGISIRQKKELREMMGKRKSGRHVNASISHELQRRGIVHLPKVILMSQLDMIILTVRGTPGERLMDRLVNALLDESDRACRQDSAQGAELGSPISRSVLVTDRLPAPKQTCSDCGLAYSVEDTLAASPGYLDNPYSYSKGSAGHCLACWLGVGPKDIAKMYAGYSERLTVKNPTPPTAQWIKATMATLGLASGELADLVGVCERTVKNWEKNGLPAHGPARLVVKEKLDRMIEDRGPY
jgi:hypothetical protein